MLGQTWRRHLDFLRISAYPFPNSNTNDSDKKVPAMGKATDIKRDILRKVLNAACMGLLPSSIRRNYEKGAPKIFCPLVIEAFKSIQHAKTLAG